MPKSKITAIFIVLLAVCVALCGCGGAEQISAYKKNGKITSVSTSIVAANENYELSWNDDAKCILFKELSSGKIWSNIPYDYLLEGGSSGSLNSTVNITIMNNTNRETTLIRGYLGAFRNGRIASKPIKNGIKVTYYFDEYEISVPINYVLKKDCLSASIDSAGIIEGIDFYLLAVSISPNLCSADNAAEENYLFVPAGSGALMYTSERAEGTRQFSGEVFGTDASRPNPISLSYEEEIRLPVFGVKSGNNAMLGVIDKGAASALIEAEAGNSKTDYSMVYPTFYLRGYDVFEERLSDLTLCSELHSENEFAVNYYPLESGNTDLNGMARRYKKYLEDNKAVKKSELSYSPFSLTVLGGINTTASALGIPYQKLNCMTDFNQALEIIKTSETIAGAAPTVWLKGFGSSGIEYDGELAGGFGFDKVFGSAKERKAIESYCRGNGIALFSDFDLIHFNDSANGFSCVSDAAKTAVFKVAEGFKMKSPIREHDTSTAFRFLKRSRLNDAVEKLIKKADKQAVSGISLYSLGDIAYSDYSEQKYYVKGNMDTDAEKLIKKVAKSGHSVASGPNSYAAAVSDAVSGVSLENGDYDAFDAVVPFYQMIFRGSKPLYTLGTNLADNFDKQVSLAAAGGTGVDFTVIGEYTVAFASGDGSRLYAAYYEDNKKLIESLKDKGFVALMEKLEGSEIKAYDILPSGVSKTTFDNGSVVYSNQTSSPADSPIGVLGAYEFGLE